MWNIRRILINWQPRKKFTGWQRSFFRFNNIASGLWNCVTSVAIEFDLEQLNECEDFILLLRLQLKSSELVEFKTETKATLSIPRSRTCFTKCVRRQKDDSEKKCHSLDSSINFTFFSFILWRRNKDSASKTQPKHLLFWFDKDMKKKMCENDSGAKNVDNK